MSYKKALYFFTKRTYKGKAMDDIHNAQRGDVLAKFIDSQSIHTDPFGENRVGERAYRRAERIVAGLHLITSHVAVDEPLRIRIRSEGLELLTHALQLRDELRSIESTRVGAFHASIRYLITLVRLLTAGGFVSFQNAEAVVSALDELGGFIGTSQRTALAESIAFTRDDFVGPSGPLTPVQRRPLLKETKDTFIIKDGLNVSDSNMSFTKENVHTPVASWRDRSRSILDVLRSGSEFSIKEVCARIPDYSEKMIQRELAALVEAGKVKKEGEKRWSRYSIVSTHD